jgi:hypothetical protein
MEPVKDFDSANKATKVGAYPSNGRVTVDVNGNVLVRPSAATVRPTAMKGAVPYTKPRFKESHLQE